MLTETEKLRSARRAKRNAENAEMLRRYRRAIEAVERAYGLGYPNVPLRNDDGSLNDVWTRWFDETGKLLRNRNDYEMAVLSWMDKGR